MSFREYARRFQESNGFFETDENVLVAVTMDTVEALLDSGPLLISDSVREEGYVCSLEDCVYFSSWDGRIRKVTSDPRGKAVDKATGPITSLCAFRGKLYFGTAKGGIDTWGGVGFAMKEPPREGSNNYINDLHVHKGRLFSACSSGTVRDVSEYALGQLMSPLGEVDPGAGLIASVESGVRSLQSFRDELYFSCSDGTVRKAALGIEGKIVARVEEQVDTLCVCAGELYFGSADGTIRRMTSELEGQTVARTEREHFPTASGERLLPKTVFGLCSIDGELYYGSGCSVRKVGYRAGPSGGLDSYQRLVWDSVLETQRPVVSLSTVPKKALQKAGVA